MRRIGISCFVLATALALPARAQTADGEIIEVLPPKEDGETEAPPEDPGGGGGGDADASSQWDYSASTGGSAWGDRSGAGAVQIGLRLGFGFPAGEAARDIDLGEGIVGQIPIWLDVGYKLSNKFLIGLYASFGFLVFKSADTPGEAGCPDGADCKGTDVRVGAQFQYSTNPGAATSFWFGAGAGYEWLTADFEGAEAQYRGFEFVNGQLGLDFAAADSSTAFGPFAAFTVGQFDQFTFRIANQSNEGDIDQKALHHWIMLGIRGTTDL